MKVVTQVMADDDTVEEGRAHVDADADGVEVRYKIGGPPPTSWKDCPLIKTQSSATMNIDAGAENAGQRLYAYAHSVNFSDPNKNGPYAGYVSVIIQG